MQPHVNLVCGIATKGGICGLSMTNGSRRNNKVESLSIEAPKRGWLPVLFDLLYPSAVAIIVINLALYVGYIEPGQLSDAVPPFVTTFLSRF